MLESNTNGFFSHFSRVGIAINNGIAQNSRTPRRSDGIFRIYSRDFSTCFLASRTISSKMAWLFCEFSSANTCATVIPLASNSSRGQNTRPSLKSREKSRIIFTAVRPFGYTPEDFAGKQFFFITNLVPRKMMDEESQGMILAVDSADKSKPMFISAEGMPVGAKIR